MIEAGTYREAAIARLEEAQLLLDAGRWSGAAYLAGRGVEAMLRALLRRDHRHLQSGHDLRDLFKSVCEGSLLSRRDETVLHADVNYLAACWYNNFRYLDDQGFLRFLKRNRLDRGLRGNAVETICRRMLESAERVIDRLELIWNRSNKR